MRYTNFCQLYINKFLFFFNFLQEKQADHLSRLKEKISTPEGVPRLFDLIKVQDERMKLAFFAALGNTVVAKDIDQVDCKDEISCSLYQIIHTDVIIISMVHVILFENAYGKGFFIIIVKTWNSQ